MGRCLATGVGARLKAKSKGWTPYGRDWVENCDPSSRLKTSRLENPGKGRS